MDKSIVNISSTVMMTSRDVKVKVEKAMEVPKDEEREVGEEGLCYRKQQSPAELLNY